MKTQKETFARCNRIIEAACKRAKAKTTGWEVSGRLNDIQLYDKYCEPGCDLSQGKIIATGNWNSVDRYNHETREREEVPCGNLPAIVGDLLEKAGAELEWSDEWISCDDCGGIFRCSPNSYGWQMAGVIQDGACICADCLQSNAADHLQSLEGKDRQCNTVESINPADYGYLLVANDFENGFHPGQDANPATIAKALRGVGCKRFLFNLDGTGQFDLTFSVWLHESESSLLEAAEAAISVY